MFPGLWDIKGTEGTEGRVNQTTRGKHLLGTGGPRLDGAEDTLLVGGDGLLRFLPAEESSGGLAVKAKGEPGVFRTPGDKSLELLALETTTDLMMPPAVWATGEWERVLVGASPEPRRVSPGPPDTADGFLREEDRPRRC